MRKAGSCRRIAKTQFPLRFEGRARGESWTARGGDSTRLQRAPALVAKGHEKKKKKKCQRGPVTERWGKVGTRGRKEESRQLAEVWLAECSRVVLLVSGWLQADGRPNQREPDLGFPSLSTFCRVVSHGQAVGVRMRLARSGQGSPGGRGSRAAELLGY